MLSSIQSKKGGGMTTATIGFLPERLTQAREARELSLTALSDLLEVSKAAISNYEKGINKPTHNTLQDISNKLNLPLNFFLKPNSVVNNSARIFYRAMSSVTKSARKRAERRFEWLKEIILYLKEYLDFPEVNLPVFDVPKDFRKITDNMIEKYAENLRDYWNLGLSPIADVIKIIESNGVFVSCGSLGVETLDAFSELDNGIPYVFLGSDKNLLARSRFDAGHELGHIIMHSAIDKSTLNTASDFKIIEEQAHHFSASFLLPSQSFVNELWGVSLDSFRSLRSKWKISIAAMISRAKQLELINEGEAKRLWINRNRRGWREFEPLDDLPTERPKMLANAFNVLLKNSVKTKEQILDDLSLTANDIEELANLPKGFFYGEEEYKLPRIKKRGNIVLLQ